MSELSNRRCDSVEIGREAPTRPSGGVSCCVRLGGADHSEAVGSRSRLLDRGVQKLSGRHNV